MTGILGIILLIGFFVLIGIVLALPVLLLRRVMMRSWWGRMFTVLIFGAGSFLLVFLITAVFTAQIPVVFNCTAYEFEPCFRYAREAGLESSAEFERLVIAELTQRNLAPPSLQQPCHIDEVGVCAVMDQLDWPNLSGSFWFNLLAGLLSGGGTAVTLLFFTRNRTTVGQAASENGRYLENSKIEDR